MNTDKRAKYILGDSDIAALRLEMVNEMFEESSKQILRSSINNNKINNAIDMGCGPGHTTSIIKEIAKPTSLIGIDMSEQHLNRAKKMVDADFIRHDITDVSLPVKNADLIFSRFILAHINNPIDTLENWCSLLNDNGILICQEDEWANSNHPVLKMYEEVKAKVVEVNGGDLYVGKILNQEMEFNGVEIVENKITIVAPNINFASKAFLYNLSIWKDDKNLRDLYSEKELLELEEGLKKLTVSDVNEDVKYEWGLRQLVLKKGVSYNE